MPRFRDTIGVGIRLAGSLNIPEEPRGFARELWGVATQPPYSLYDKVRRVFDLMRSFSPSFGDHAH